MHINTYRVDAQAVGVATAERVLHTHTLSLSHTHTHTLYFKSGQGFLLVFNIKSYLYNAKRYVVFSKTTISVIVLLISTVELAHRRSAVNKMGLNTFL